MSRERAIAACEPFPVARRIIEHFPNLIGRNAPGNGSNETHFTDEDLGEAIAMPASEAQLLYKIGQQSTCRRVVEIGAYIGWSTAHLLDGLQWRGSFQRLTVIDPFTESDKSPSQTEDRFWCNLTGSGSNVDRIDVFRGASPDILPVVKPRNGWDFAFIDGEHSGKQPLRDIMGLLPCLMPGSVVVWHDAWLPGVGDAIGWLAGEGWANVELPTANLMTISFQGDRPLWLGAIEAKARKYVAVANG